jgi:glycosyltransferase involved in cell wall biosynthesis
MTFIQSKPPINHYHWNNINKYTFLLEILICKEDKNAAQNRNIAALKLLDMDYITFIDADDIMHPERIEILLEVIKKEESDKSYLSASRWTTVIWGLFCIMVAFYASRVGNLIEAVNILGSLFYGTILGIFLVAFYMKRISGTAVFYAAFIAEAFIVYAWITDLTAFLWLNVIGCLLVMGFAYCIQLTINKRNVIK